MKFCILGPFLLIDLAEQRHCFPNTDSGYREMARAFCDSKSIDFTSPSSSHRRPSWARSA
ncbi:hypothetical protein CJJ19_09080 [Candidatus Williamhamiltonella defendens]|nr:hypothetical protein CJJ19_02655 [Candidatus Hamiltonella defensa]AYB48639.1 hypothetical protein CJJ19_03150 [Candidatus Hamiltonella defensa]AYB49569.1 hypothetical protein CJJ19_09080 [Candidatus Hamiltonella defensa]